MTSTIRGPIASKERDPLERSNGHSSSSLRPKRKKIRLGRTSWMRAALDCLIWPLAFSPFPFPRPPIVPVHSYSSTRPHSRFFQLSRGEMHGCFYRFGPKSDRFQLLVSASRTRTTKRRRGQGRLERRRMTITDTQPPIPFVSFAAFCSNPLRCLLSSIVEVRSFEVQLQASASRTRTTTRTRTIGEAPDDHHGNPTPRSPLFPLLPSVQILCYWVPRKSRSARLTNRRRSLLHLCAE
jgi:hypothetical protein